MKNSALLLVDIQNDFCTGGALAVNESDIVIQTANQLIHDFNQSKNPIIASLDWHPADHLSFAENSGTTVGEIGILNGLPQVWWPVHCVQHSYGAAFHPELNQALINHIIYKGQNPLIDSYSAFFDNDHEYQTGLHTLLQTLNIKHLYILGIATDYCVKFTVLDALLLGYQVTVITDGCRGVNIQNDDSEKALEEMQAKGATLIDSAHWLNRNNQ
ncbi:bifunctional nicotinamidase/pyrazinamidase [Proteus hauseri]|uniref:nicotinamidase n=1 Tax=Proteus cibi TaxID=2050966 RepID=A0ABU6EBU5_9GAMM|nr:bifunctional nicotinamidase/pyrazinamidase [Proteus cibi]MBG6031728.1 bifunctional nicotinamidase/pyrazinamidase [Proteus hauseri]MBS6210265.1 bifunctional nicotinamidase/pyrazinamidase [Proteus hauseri]MEB6856125.1 bifunctional nicotinamidase/pyrazinamidase [Proteus cibi]MEB7087882.1 bifunctional nicotinamidase/pyrazinamidase [Proteus cibi]